jgi:hypothetical protein
MTVRPVSEAPARRSPRVNWRLLSLAIATACIVLLAAANAHLVYVAVESQPDCVGHAKDTGRPGTYMAAKSAC